MRQMGIDDHGQGRFVGLGPDVEQPGPDDLSLADPGRGVGHALGAEIGGVAENRREQCRGEADRVAGAPMGEPTGEAGPGAVAQLLEFEVQFLLFLGYPGISARGTPSRRSPSCVRASKVRRGIS